MTLRELEAECIRYTAEDKDMGLSAESYHEYKQKETYKDYINNVLPSINRAIARIVTEKKIPYKTCAIKAKKQYKLNELEKEFDIAIRDVYSVTSISTSGELIHYRFHLVGNFLTILDLPYGYESYLLLNINFIPFVKSLKHTDEEDQRIEGWETSDTSIDLEKIGIPDELCYGVIVYFVKADLFVMDNPNLASNYRQYADSYLNEYDITNTIVEKQDMVSSIASIF